MKRKIFKEGNAETKLKKVKLADGSKIEKPDLKIKMQLNGCVKEVDDSDQSMKYFSLPAVWVYLEHFVWICYSIF